MTFALVAFGVCLLVFGVALIVAWPAPHIPTHAADTARHRFQLGAPDA